MHYDCLSIAIDILYIFNLLFYNGYFIFYIFATLQFQYSLNHACFNPLLPNRLWKFYIYSELPESIKLLTSMHQR